MKKISIEVTKYKVSKSQLVCLQFAKRVYTDGRVPPSLFRDHRSIPVLLKFGLIELWAEYGSPMYKFTKRGLEFI